MANRVAARSPLCLPVSSVVNLFSTTGNTGRHREIASKKYRYRLAAGTFAASGGALGMVVTRAPCDVPCTAACA